jgi:hypothetical protein
MTLKDFEKELRVKVLATWGTVIKPANYGKFTDIKVRVSSGDELFIVEVNWEHDEKCFNKYADFTGEYSTDVMLDETDIYASGCFAQFKIHRKRRTFEIGLVGEHFNDFEYLGFKNLKYGVQLYFENRQALGSFREFSDV